MEFYLLRNSISGCCDRPYEIPSLVYNAIILIVLDACRLLNTECRFDPDRTGNEHSAGLDVIMQWWAPER